MPPPTSSEQQSSWGSTPVISTRRLVETSIEQLEPVLIGVKVGVRANKTSSYHDVSKEENKKEEEEEEVATSKEKKEGRRRRNH